jgi:hypothetical protein
MAAVKHPGGACEFPVAPVNRAGESRRRQALPAVLAMVVWCSGQWSGALASGGSALAGGLVLRWWPRHDSGVASVASERSASAFVRA